MDIRVFFSYLFFSFIHKLLSISLVYITCPKNPFKFNFSTHFSLSNTLNFLNPFESANKTNTSFEHVDTSKISNANVCKLANASVIARASKLRLACIANLVNCLRKNLPVCNVKELDADIRDELLIEALSTKCIAK